MKRILVLLTLILTACQVTHTAEPDIAVAPTPLLEEQVVGLEPETETKTDLNAVYALALAEAVAQAQVCQFTEQEVAVVTERTAKDFHMTEEHIEQALEQHLDKARAQVLEFSGEPDWAESCQSMRFFMLK